MIPRSEVGPIPALDVVLEIAREYCVKEVERRRYGNKEREEPA